MAELIYHSAKVAASLAAEYGLKGISLASRVIKEVGEHWKEVKDHIDAIMDLHESEAMVKAIGEEAARAEDFQKQVEAAADKAARVLRERATALRNQIQTGKP